MEAISNFVEAFINNQDQYSTIKEEVDKLCKEKLSEKGISFLWDSRVKKAESLRKKLLDRKSDYDTELENVNDIKDLVAGRVIITRWKDFVLVEKVITENFDLKQTCQHPKIRQNLVTLQQRFRGYDGQHFYVTRRLADDGPFRDVLVEIQVMSGFMWAFSAVEHDITYKKLHGESHDDLRSLLEIYKGTANVAEVVMEMLDNFQFDFRQENAGSTLREEIRKFAVDKEQIIAERLRNLERNKEIVLWISNADVENDHNQQRATLGSHYKDSGQWFRPYYDKFLGSSDASVFWLAGSVGTGKSSLVSNIIEWHFKKIQSRKRERLVFFYCSRKQAGRTTSLEVLRSLIAQLAKPTDGFPTSSVIEGIYQSRKGCPIEIQECSDLLVRLLEEHEKTTFIVDALDECENADELLLHLRDLTRQPVKFFFSSRNQVKVRKAFPNCANLELDSQKDLIMQDIQIYVTSQVKERETLKLGRRLLDGEYPELEDTLIDVLVDHAQGMFIWVKLRLELFLGRQSRIRLPADVIKKLDMLKKGDGTVKATMLDKAYEEIYDDNTEAGSASRTFAMKALKWMMCAQRPLSITELAEAVSISEIEARDEISEETLLLICSNFIIADKSRVAQFAHLSVPEYLGRRETDDGKEYSLEEAHIQAVMTSLTCLKCYQAGFRNLRAEIWPYYDGNVWKDTFEDTNIYSYSIVYWANHMAAISSRNRNQPIRLLFHETIMYWLDILPSVNVRPGSSDQSYRLENATSRPKTFFFAACVWGLMDMIPEATFDEDSKRENLQGVSGLVLAARYGNLDAVSFLLDRGVNLNELSAFSQDALLAASVYGYEGIVRLLLDQGADANVQGDRNLLHPLEEASRYNRLNVMRLLLEKGADVNARSIVSLSGTALQAASSHGHENATRLLLDNGADVNTQGGTYGTALQAASAEGHENVVRLLLDNGADVNAQSMIYGTALEKASAKGHETIVRLLLDKGADINLQGGYYDTALQAACAEGHEIIVRLLLDKGADVNVQGGYHGYALQAASTKNHETIVRLLLDNGAHDYYTIIP